MAMPPLPAGFRVAQGDEPDTPQLPGGFQIVQGDRLSAVDKLPELPEATGLLAGLDASPLDKAQIAFAGVTMGPNEFAGLLKDKFGDDIGITYDKDEDGDLIVIATNRKNNQSAVINKPGLSKQDVLQFFGLGALYFPASMAATVPARLAGATGTATGLQALEKIAGGEFDPSDILFETLAALGGEMIEPVIRKGAGAMRSRATRKLAEADAAAEQAVTKADQAEVLRMQSELSPEAGTALQQEAARTQQQLLGEIADLQAEQTQSTQEGMRELADLTRQRGGVRQVAEQVMPDPARITAAERLGVSEVLTPGMISENPRFVEFYQALKSVPGSRLGQAEKEALATVAERADQLIIDAGGFADKARVSQNVLDDMTATQQTMLNQAEFLYGQLRELIPEETPIQAPNTFKFINEQARVRGGPDYLSKAEKNILKRLDPETNPTYARLDDIRKEIGDAKRAKKGVFKNARSGLLTKLEQVLRADQEAIANQFAGGGELFNAAQASVASRKELETQMQKLFGKELTGNLTRLMRQAVTGAAAGDVQALNKLLTNVPEDLKQEVIATAMQDALTQGGRKKGTAISFPGFVDFYEALNRQPTVKNLLFKELDPAVRKNFDDLYTVSKGINNALNANIRTGLIQSITNAFADVDTIATKMIDAAGELGRTGAAEAMATTMGAPGAGVAGRVAGIMTRGKEKDAPIDAAIKLLGTPEFQRLARDYASRQRVSKEAIARAEQALMRKREYKQWLNTLNQTERAAVDSLGFLRWATAPAAAVATDDQSNQAEMNPMANAAATMPSP